jgi:hypothetical protein
MAVEPVTSFEWLRREDYSKAKTLARVSHLGFEFRVVRFRSGGKPFKQYLTLLHGDMPVTNDPGGETDVAAYARKMKSALEMYCEPTALKARLDQMADAFNYWKQLESRQ